jgi:hypothetical protein
MVALAVNLLQHQEWHKTFFKFNNPHTVVMPKRKKAVFMVVEHQLLPSLLGHNLVFKKLLRHPEV